jgi:predicted phosphodiesterase
VFEFAKDFKPTVVVLGGDLHDWSAVCHWIADQSRHLGGETIEKNYKELRDVLLNPLQAAVGKKTRKIFIRGNHEAWLDKAIELNPNGRGYWELDRNIDVDRFNMELLPFNKAYKVNDNLCYIHGLYVNEYHAKKTVLAYHTSVIYGHVHTVQSHTIVSPVDSDKFYKGQAVGCLCNLNPHYAEHRPNAWINGFNYAYVDDDGSFEDYTVIMVKNKFWGLGRKYR